MRGSKHTVIVCWGIIIISLIGIIVLHKEFDIGLQEIITRSEKIYDYDIRNFYKGLWSNIFTGAIVSLLISYASYWNAKHDTEFSFVSSQQLMTMGLRLINTYWIAAQHTNFSQETVIRFRHTIDSLHQNYDRMIQASNDYHPFFQSEKSGTLKTGKKLLQNIWLEMGALESDLEIYADSDSLRETFSNANAIVEAQKTQLDELHSKVWSYL